MKISHNPSRERVNRAPWRLYNRGKSTWHWSETDAQAKADELTTDGVRQMRKRPLTKRELDDYFHMLEILQGVPPLTAARHYVEAFKQQTDNGRQDCAVLIARFVKTLRGRKKYLKEATRNLKLLSAAIGSKRITAVTSEDVDTFISSFKSDWSHDAALKFSKAFFKWACGPKIRARTTNPCAIFDARNPHGSKIYLTLDDVAHVLKVARSDFPKILPAVALQLFAGLRTEEIIRADWSMIRRGTIRLEAEVAKMGQVKGKRVPRIIDFWPLALDAHLPATLPTKGKIARNYRRIKTALIKRCKKTKPDFRWGQNAFRHSYGTYAYAFFQSADRVAKLMGERDVDTLINHYAEYETETNGQKFLSIGSGALQDPPLPKNALALLQSLSKQITSENAALPAATGS